MKAAVFKAPHLMEIEEVALEACRDAEVLLKVEACAVCGTDVRIYNHGHKNVKPPQTIGHEIVGTIAEVGSRATGNKVGERVAVVTPVGCGKCNFCRKGFHNLCVNFKAIGYDYQGGFAEYMKMPSDAVKQGNLLSIPKDLDAAEATLIEPLSCVINGQEYLHIEPGDTVVVVGAGPVGCMHGKLAQVKGASSVYVADVSPDRLRLAERFGFTSVLNAAETNLVEEVMRFTSGFGAEVVIVACSARKAQEESLAMTAKQGRISFFGGLPKDAPFISFDSNLLHYREISVHGAFASHASQYVKALSLIACGQFQARDFITHRFPLSNIVQAIETAQSAVGLKVVVIPEAS